MADERKFMGMTEAEFRAWLKEQGEIDFLRSLEPHVWVVSPEVYRKILDLIESPPAPTEALRRALRRRSE